MSRKMILTLEHFGARGPCLVYYLFLVGTTQQSQQSGKNGQKLHWRETTKMYMNCTEQFSIFSIKKGLDSNSGRQGVSALTCSKNS